MALLQTGANHTCIPRPHQWSVITPNFNTLWCEALNKRKESGITHFAMMHSDISPEPNWLDTLLAEQRATGADILGVHAPIKDGRGLSSTVLRSHETGKTRRLTMTELDAAPVRMTAADYPGHDLLLNTGLWICDFTQPWVEKIWFRQEDGIFKDEASGEWRVTFRSEDWLFSLDAVRMGLKTAATKAVKLFHLGHAPYPNYEAWGQWKTDEAAALAVPYGM